MINGNGTERMLYNCTYTNWIEYYISSKWNVNSEHVLCRHPFWISLTALAFNVECLYILMCKRNEGLFEFEFYSGTADCVVRTPSILILWRKEYMKKKFTHTNIIMFIVISCYRNCAEQWERWTMIDGDVGTYSLAAWKIIEDKYLVQYSLSFIVSIFVNTYIYSFS